MAVSLEVLVAAFLLFLMLKPELIKSQAWFKVAVLAFALRLVLHILWLIFEAIPATAPTFNVISRNVSQVLLGLTIVCAVMGQVGSLTNVAAEAKGAAKAKAKE